MPTGRQTQQTGRAGEYYVAAELNRRGFDAVTFTGNMPEFDAIAVTARRKTLYIQVKAQTGRGWALNINERLRKPTRNMFWILVLLPKTDEDERTRYWVIPDRDMRGIIQGRYEAKPHEWDGKKITLLRLKVEDVAGWEDGWGRLG